MSPTTEMKKVIKIIDYLTIECDSTDIPLEFEKKGKEWIEKCDDGYFTPRKYTDIEELAKEIIRRWNDTYDSSDYVIVKVHLKGTDRRMIDFDDAVSQLAKMKGVNSKPRSKNNISRLENSVRNMF